MARFSCIHKHDVLPSRPWYSLHTCIGEGDTYGFRTCFDKWSIIISCKLFFYLTQIQKVVMIQECLVDGIWDCVFTVFTESECQCLWSMQRLYQVWIWWSRQEYSTTSVCTFVEGKYQHLYINVGPLCWYGSPMRTAPIQMTWKCLNIFWTQS